MYVSGLSDAHEKQPTHTCNRTLRQTSPFSALYVSEVFSLFFSLHLLPLLLLTAPDLKCCFPQVSSAFPAEDDAAEAGDEPVEAWAGKFYFQISLRH